MASNTGWGNVADWYEDHLKSEDTYHAKVVAPNLLRLAQLTPNMRVLDLACGEGYFTRLINASGASVTGADIAPELIAAAKKRSPEIRYEVTPAEKLSFALERSFDLVTCVLAIQNMSDLRPVFSEVSRVLDEHGRFLFVLNHPSYRIPQSSSWGYDEKAKTQYRRVDAYLTPTKHEIIMNPGGKLKEVTYSFHRSLQDFSKALGKSGFAISKIEEWISHRTSEEGPKKKAEDKARKEIPLFLCVEAFKIGSPR